MTAERGSLYGALVITVQRRLHRTSAASLGVLLLSAALPGCTRPRVAAAAAPREAPPPTATHTTTDETPEPTDAVFGRAEEDADRLAIHYCHHGGSLFGPPTDKPYPKYEDWDYAPGDPLASCSEVQPTVLQTWKTKTASATLVRIEVVVEDAEGNGVGLLGFQEWVTIRTPESVFDYMLTDVAEHQSEEAPDERLEIDLETVVFKDIAGGGAPDFIAARTYLVGDCYECDFCYSQSEEQTYLAICGDHATKPGCIDVPLTSAKTTEPRLDVDDDCSEKPDPDEESQTWGFAVDFELPEKGLLVTTTRVPAPDEEPLSGLEPPVLGRFELDKLFETLPPQFRFGTE